MINFQEIMLIFQREFKEILKDRKTIFLAVVLPIAIYPFILGGVDKLISLQLNRMSQESINIGLNPSLNWLIPLLKDVDTEARFDFRTSVEDPSHELEEGTLQLWLDDGGSNLNTARQVLVYFSAPKDLSREAMKYLQSLAEKIDSRFVQQKLDEQNLKINVNSLLILTIQDVSSDQAKSGYLAGKIVPLLMILMILSGSSFAAIDLIAGEKERGSLETLLLAPVLRSSIIWGKFLVVFLIAAISAFLNLMGVYITLSFKLLDIPMLREIHFSLSAPDLLLIFLLIVPMAVFFSALLMIIASYADTFKEGQYYVLPFSLFAFIPALPALMPTLSTRSILCLVPITSLALAIKEVLSGVYHWGALSIAFLVNAGLSLASLRLASRLLQRESLLPGSKPVEFDRDNQLVKHAFMLWAVSLLLNYFLGSLVQDYDMIIGLWVTEIGLIAFPAYLFIKMHRLDATSIIGLKPFTVRQLSGALCIEVVVMIAAFMVMVGQSQFIPMPKSFLEFFSGSMTNSTHAVWLTIITYGISAGVCEELLFRGVLTGVFTRKLNPLAVILIVGFLFGLAHFHVFRIFPTATIGIGYTAVRVVTGNVYLTMLLHTLHNMTLMYLSIEKPEILSNFLQANLFSPYLIVLLLCFSVVGFLLIRPRRQ